ncbi:hypothetical protein [Shewanella septentrionalis]|uniref:Uncharacterized protein n=1 Tax=Shewanella septentrionalis TaxID=2952223 RepID=A0A9X2WR65_9GAMM|nr:hypothetical protein [Shewanella septentrionalis]MCT7944076.1 hypothetical protein [Shewanella septentrionalis]
MTTPSASPQAEQQTQTHESETSFWWLIILLAVIAAFLLTLYFMNFNGGWGNQGDFGAFGDFLGGVLNPILGFATVGLLIWSLKMQMKELSLSNQQLALTRQELKETKEETALSRQAMEAQVAHLKQDAKLTELQGVLKAQLDIINDLLATQVYSRLTDRGPIGITFDKILNNHNEVRSYQGAIIELLNSEVPNPLINSIKALEIQVIQLGHISLEYSKETNSKLYALPYLVNAISLLSKFYKFQPNESIETLLKEIDTQIKKGVDEF